MPITAASLKAEAARLEQAYARRKKGHLYSRFNPAYLFMVQEREKLFLRLLSRHGCVAFETKKIFEVGCGSGDMLRDFVKWGARPENVIGIDLLPDRVAEAIQLCPKAMGIHQGNAAKLPFPDEAFDVVVQSTVFTSNNPRNPDVRGVKRREIYELFADCRIDLQRITLAPPIARLIAPYSWLMCYLLERIPLLCTHYVGIIRKQNAANRRL